MLPPISTTPRETPHTVAPAPVRPASNVWVTMERHEDGLYHPTYHLTEQAKWTTAYTVLDPAEFVAHMHRLTTLPSGHLTREQYEQSCAGWEITPASDDDLGNYADEHGDFGMSHYHTNPENRLFGVAASLRQRRWWAVKRTRAEASASAPKARPVESRPWGSRGIRYDEPCEACGRTGEVDNDTGLCLHCGDPGASLSR